MATTDMPETRTDERQDVLIRRERIAQLRGLIKQFNSKDSAAIGDMWDLIHEKNSQIDLLDDLIDQVARKLHHQIDELQATAKETVEKTALQMWEASPTGSLVQKANEKLLPGRMLCASLEDEIQRAEADEVVMLSRSEVVDALGDQLVALLQSQIRLPTASSFDFATLWNRFQKSSEEMGLIMSRSTEAFIRSLDNQMPAVSIPNEDNVQLEEQQSFEAESLLSPFERNNKFVRVNGAVYAGEEHILYFTDYRNASKIKSLDLNTRQLAEVHISERTKILLSRILCFCIIYS